MKSQLQAKLMTTQGTDDLYFEQLNRAKEVCDQLDYGSLPSYSTATIKIKAPVFVFDILRGSTWDDGLYDLKVKTKKISPLNPREGFYIPNKDRPLRSEDPEDVPTKSEYETFLQNYIGMLQDVMYSLRVAQENKYSSVIQAAGLPPIVMSTFKMRLSIFDWFTFALKFTQNHICWEVAMLAEQVDRLMDVTFPKSWQWFGNNIEYGTRS